MINTYSNTNEKRKNFLIKGVFVCIQNSAVNNVSNVIIIQKANTKSNLGQHRPPINAKVGSSAKKEQASSADR